MPFAEDEAAKVGRRVFRKQILPVGSLEYEGRTLNFTKDYLKGLAESFNAGAFDQVPFQLANDRNEHNFDPEKYRGEVKALELSDDGLYGVVEMTDEGAEVVSKNPKLGVSARIVEGLEKGGNAIQHVLGTLDPRVTGMKPWEAVNLSASDTGVVDLTSASFSAPVSDEPTTTKDRKDDTPPKTAEELLAQMLSGDTDTTKDQPQVASLSEEDRRAIELAKSESEAARREAREAREELARTRFEKTRDDLVAAGVPPADVNLAEPILKGGSGTIELSNGEKVDAHNVITKLLESRKGTIDLTTVGVGSGAAGSQEAEARELAEKWAGKNGGGD